MTVIGTFDVDKSYGRITPMSRFVELMTERLQRHWSMMAALLAALLLTTAAPQAQAQSGQPSISNFTTWWVWDWNRAPRYRGYFMADVRDNRVTWFIHGSNFGNDVGVVYTNNIDYRFEIVDW